MLVMKTVDVMNMRGLWVIEGNGKICLKENIKEESSGSWVGSEHVSDTTVHCK